MDETMNLESSLKKKLDSGEITQDEYNELMIKFGDLDLLGTKVDQADKKPKSPKRWRFAGSATVDGEEVNVPVKVSGRLLVNGDLKCPMMKVSGKTTIDGNLTVIDGLRTSGSLLINEEAKLGGHVKVSGKLEVKDKLYITESGKISGKLTVGGDLISGELLKVSGKIQAATIKSSGLIKSSGTVSTIGDLIAEEFISSGGSSTIGGNLEAQLIEIAKRYREGTSSGYDEDEDVGPIEDLNDIGRFVTNLVGKIVPKIVNMGFGGDLKRPPKIFEVEGNMEGDTIDISYTHVKGDLIANDVLFGPEVTVDGRIIYKNSFESPEQTEYNAEKKE
jgi:cytoskeletal protein CcmA (bactofilin family)